MDPRLITPYLIVAIIAWAYYRRMRRWFGRQRVQDGRMWFRVGLLTLIAVMVTVVIARDTEMLGALFAGIAGGAALGYLGLRHTKFEITSEGRFYTPHTYIGLAVSALFAGRILYRFLAVYNGTMAPAVASQGAAATFQHSPFTVAVIGALVGYYVLYYLGVLQRTRRPIVGATA